MTAVAEPRTSIVELEDLVVDAAPPAVFSAGDAPPERTLLDILEATARAHPTALALEGDGVTLTYRALLWEVKSLRWRLSEVGIGVGDRVAVRVPSGTVDLYVSI